MTPGLDAREKKPDTQATSTYACVKSEVRRASRPQVSRGHFSPHFILLFAQWTKRDCLLSINRCEVDILLLFLRGRMGYME